MLRRALFLLGMMLGAANADFQFTQITTGNISGYDHVAPGVPPTWKNDASGAARVGNINVIVDDLMSAVRMWNAYTDEAVSGQNIYLPTTHKDLEGATQIFDGTKLLITCSMTGPNDDDYNRLSRYDVDQINLGVLNEETLVMRPTIINYVNSTLGQQDPAWFARTQLYDEKSGNLNIEGISVTAPDSDYDFVWGFRGPLFGPTFATFDSKGAQILNEGKTILLFAKNVFGDDPTCGAQYHIETIDLRGQGVRSIEYIPALGGYLISSGPIPKADVYSLWLYRPADSHGNPAQTINILNKLPQFSSLGRPENILHEPNRFVTIISEDDPTFTVQPPFNFLRFQVDDIPTSSCPVVPSCRADVTSTVVSSWGAGGQYTLNIHNPTDGPITSLTLELSADDAAKLSSVWNLQSIGNNQYALPSYAGALASGASYTQVGYISTNGPLRFNVVALTCE